MNPIKLVLRIRLIEILLDLWVEVLDILRGGMWECGSGGYTSFRDDYNCSDELGSFGGLMPAQSING